MSIGTYNTFPENWTGQRRVNPNDFNSLVYNVTGSQIKSGSFAVVGPVYISGSLMLSGSTNIGLTSNIGVLSNNNLVGVEGNLNFTSGSGINLTLTNDSFNNKVNIRIDTGSSVGQGGGGGYNLVQDEGLNLPNRTTLNVVGSPVTASDDPANSRTLITIDPYANSTASISSVGIGTSPATGSTRKIADAGHVHATPPTWPPSTHASTHYAGGSDSISGNITLATGSNLTILNGKLTQSGGTVALSGSTIFISGSSIYLLNNNSLPNVTYIGTIVPYINQLPTGYTTSLGASNGQEFSNVFVRNVVGATDQNLMLYGTFPGIIELKTNAQADGNLLVKGTLQVQSGSFIIDSSGNIIGNTISGSNGFRTSSGSTFGTITIISGSNLIVNSGSISVGNTQSYLATETTGQTRSVSQIDGGNILRIGDYSTGDLTIAQGSQGFQQFNIFTPYLEPIYRFYAGNPGTLIGSIDSTGKISGSGFQTSGNSIIGSTVIITGSSLFLTGGPFVVSGSWPFGINSSGNISRLGNIGTNLVTGSVTQTNVKFGKPVDADFISPIDGLLALDNSANVLYARSSGTWTAITGSLISGSSGTGSAHTILSATHTDTVAGAASRGDLIAANSSSIWAKLGIGTTNSYLTTTNGLDPSWQTNITLASGSNINILSGSITSPFGGARFNGNITGSIITGSGLQTSGNISTSGNITTTGNITATGNVTANTFFGTVSGSIIVTGSVTIPSGSSLTLQSGSIIPFATVPQFTIFSGSVVGYTGPFYAINGSTNRISFSGTDASMVISGSINSLPVNGGIIFIKSGTYPITNMLDIKNINNVSIIGEGTATRLLTSGNVVLIRFSGSNGSNLKSVYLDGTSQTQNDSNMRVVNVSSACDNIVLEDLEIANGGYYGINVLDSNRVTINRCRSHDNFIHGIHLGSNNAISNTKCLVTNNDFYNNGQNGINDRGHNQLAARADNMFLNNRCHNNLLVGLEVKSDNAIIDGNYCYSNGTHGIRTETYINTDAGHKVVTNNRCFSNATGSTADGIRIVGDRAIVTNNWSSGSSQTYGIQLFDGAAEGFPTDYCIVMGNDVKGNSTTGIKEGAGANNVIVGNLL